MTLGPWILVPILLVFGTLFLVMLAVSTAIMAGLISVGYHRWRVSPGRPSQATADEPGLGLLDSVEDETTNATDRPLLEP